ncbi:hypothetical protein CSA57_10385 [candidate division KSB3 bacterium]|nr:MAG: hypothetical protein CSA57_10385 [candidate division KSB3 bacterium]
MDSKTTICPISIHIQWSLFFYKASKKSRRKKTLKGRVKASNSQEYFHFDIFTAFQKIKA